MVVGQTQLVGRVVMAVGEVNELYRFHPEGFVAVRHAGRYEDLPWLKAPGEDGVDRSEGLAANAQIVKKDLHHAGARRPQIGLLGVIVDGLDGPRIGQRERDLNLARSLRDHPRGETLAEARELGEESAVVRVQRKRR